MATLKLNSYELFTQSENNRPEFGTGVPSGTILQVQYTQFTGTATMTSVAADSDNVVCDGVAGSGSEILNVSITPRFNNSKMWLQVSWCGEYSAANMVYNSMFFIYRNTLKLGQAEAPNRCVGIMPPALSYEATDANSTLESCTFQFFDTPGTTDTVVYKLGISTGSSAMTLYTNRTLSDSTDISRERGISSISVMEIAA